MPIPADNENVHIVVDTGTRIKGLPR
jgi:hypothetical protein